MPLFFRKHIVIEGRPYQDYPFTPFSLLQYQEGTRPIIIFDTREQNPFLKFIGKMILGNTGEGDISDAVTYIQPEIKAHLLSRNKITLTEAFEGGRKYAKENKQIFLR